MAWLAECEHILAQVIMKLQNQNQITGQRISMRCIIQTGEEDKENLQQRNLQQENLCLTRNLAALQQDFEYVLTNETVEKAQLRKDIDFLKQALKKAQEESNQHERQGNVGELKHLSDAEGQPAEAAALREELDKSRREKSELKQEIREIRLELQDQILRLEAEGAETAALREKNTELHAEVNEMKNAMQKERIMVSGVDELEAEVVRLKAAFAQSESEVRRLSDAEGQSAEAAALREDLDKSETAMAVVLSWSEKHKAKTLDESRCPYGHQPKIWLDDPRQRSGEVSGGVVASQAAPETLEASRVSLLQHLLEPKKLVSQLNANNAGTAKKLLEGKDACAKVEGARDAVSRALHPCMPCQAASCLLHVRLTTLTPYQRAAHSNSPSLCF